MQHRLSGSYVGKTTLGFSGLILLFVCMFLPGRAAWADMIDPHMISYGPFSTDWSTVLRVPQFDPAKGTLIQVDFSAQAFITVAGTVQNTYGTMKSFTTATTVDTELAGLTLSDPSLTLNLSNILANTHRRVPAGVSVTFPTQTNGPSTDQLVFNSNLAQYIGLGTLDLPAKTHTAITVIELGTLNPLSLINTSGVTTTAQLDLTVDYHYTYTPLATATPEPSTGALFLLGGIVIYWYQRSRKRIA